MPTSIIQFFFPRQTKLGEVFENIFLAVRCRASKRFKLMDISL